MEGLCPCPDRTEAGLPEESGNLLRAVATSSVVSCRQPQNMGSTRLELLIPDGFSGGHMLSAPRHRANNSSGSQYAIHFRQAPLGSRQMEEDEGYDCHIKLVLVQFQFLDIHQSKRPYVLVPGQAEHPF
jgi:hypothetical protein